MTFTLFLLILNYRFAGWQPTFQIIFMRGWCTGTGMLNLVHLLNWLKPLFSDTNILSTNPINFIQSILDRIYCQTYFTSRRNHFLFIQIFIIPLQSVNKFWIATHLRRQLRSYNVYLFQTSINQSSLARVSVHPSVPSQTCLSDLELF